MPVEPSENLARILGLSESEVVHLAGCLVCGPGFRCDLNPELIRQAIALIRAGGPHDPSELTAAHFLPGNTEIPVQEEPEWMSDPDVDPRDLELRKKLHANAQKHGPVDDPRQAGAGA